MVTLALSLVLAAQTRTPSIEDYVQPNLHDVSIIAHILQSNQGELKKIKKDFGQNYRFDSASVKYKEPFKLRLDSTIEDTTITFIYNGARLKISAPGAHISSSQDLSSETARRETALDFGLLVPCLFDGFFDAKFIHMDRETGDPVFDLTYVDKGEQARYRIWIDPVHHITTKREWYNRYGSQLATFYYDHPMEVNGVWLPTMITVKNTDNKVAGSTRYDNIKVNAGIADSVFATGK